MYVTNNNSCLIGMLMTQKKSSNSPANLGNIEIVLLFPAPPQRQNELKRWRKLTLHMRSLLLIFHFLLPFPHFACTKLHCIGAFWVFTYRRDAIKTPISLLQPSYHPQAAWSPERHPNNRTLVLLFKCIRADAAETSLEG